MSNTIGRAFSRDELRAKIVPAYMGLVKQCDDQMGVLFRWMGDTMIEITSDHGHYLGNDWLGEKALFHESSVRIPMIIYDPSDATDNTHGTRLRCLDRTQ